jgi:hypothetical protein
MQIDGLELDLALPLLIWAFFLGLLWPREGSSWNVPRMTPAEAVAGDWTEIDRWEKRL